MQLRKFSDSGIEVFDDILSKANSSADVLEHRHRLLQDREHSSVVASDIHLNEKEVFGNRYQAGEYLVQKLKKIPDDILIDTGLWAWLALFFFEQICPEKIRNRALYIPDSNSYRRFYRHLLYGPFSIYREHSDEPKRALVVLCPPVYQPGDVVESLVSRQTLISSPTVMEAATKLYVVPGNVPGGFDYKKGAGRKNKGGGRRFAAIMMQFDLTHDLYQISPDDLIALLPSEFDEFHP